MRILRVAVIAAVSIGTVITLPGMAGATPQVGRCTDSYTLYDEPTLAAIDPAVADIFGVIDTNQNGFICFKAYPNGDHAGHGGNLVDDKAGPHT